MPSYATILLSIGLLAATPLVDAASKTLRYPSSPAGAAGCYSTSGTVVTASSVDACFNKCVARSDCKAFSYQVLNWGGILGQCYVKTTPYHGESDITCGQSIFTNFVYYDVSR